MPGFCVAGLLSLGGSTLMASSERTYVRCPTHGGIARTRSRPIDALIQNRVMFEIGAPGAIAVLGALTRRRSRCIQRFMVQIGARCR